jgi:hypothetical protein
MIANDLDDKKDASVGGNSGLDFEAASAAASTRLAQSPYFLRGRQPIPPIEENTTWIAAGVLTVGIELRQLDADILRAHLDSLGPWEEVDSLGHRTDTEFIDTGPSFHVLDASDRFEYIRFDCFADDPHYHYLSPSLDYGVIKLGFDTAANGPMIPWILAMISDRLPIMLAKAGAAHLASKVDQSAMPRVAAELGGVLRGYGL